MKKRIIGIPTNLGYAHCSPSSFKEISCINTDFYKAVTDAGAVPICLPPINSLEDIHSQTELCDGILLPGGNDINPLCYDEEPYLSLGESNTTVDHHQLQLTKIALSKQLPILGICRGHQLLNIAQGGNVYQDLSEYPSTTLQHMQQARRDHLCHTVTTLPSSKIRKLLGNKISVNSFHHQAIHKLGQNVIATAFSSDGLIEAIEIKEYPFAVGIQWHPEIMLRTSKDMLVLFEAFIKACKV